MNQQSQPERRNFNRVLFDTPVTLDSGGRRYESTLIDLSLKDALVRLPEQFSATTGSPVELRIGLNEGQLTITMQTVVAHATGGTLGLKCLNIDIDSITHLRRLIELNLGDPELLKRDLGTLSWDGTTRA
ncbi:MAG: PilZ domain-containing protein [gamma proteobacterium symbiont of Phacoides pectinatus]